MRSSSTATVDPPNLDLRLSARSIFRDASSASHLGGVPRRVVLTTVGAFAKLWTTLLNRTRVYNLDTLIDLVQSRPSGTPLLTLSNHMSTLDDPLIWGLKGLPISDSKLSRWTLAAEDICFTNFLYSYFFSLGKCIPIRRGAGIHQPYMDEALSVINRGDWLHTFPEGKLSQEEGPMRRLKWGLASLITRADVQPIVLPIAHSGLEKVLPEKFWYGRRPPVPLIMKHISIVVGEPMVFDIPQLKRTAKAMTANISSCAPPLPIDYDNTSPTIVGSGILSRLKSGGESLYLHMDHSLKTVPKQGLGDRPVVLDDIALNWMYAHMSENMRCILQELVGKARSINKVHE